jgi:two-component system, LytTR family, response regulator
MRSVIIDDEHDSHIALGEQLRRNHPDLEVVGSGYNVAEGRQLIQEKRPDLLFLDIDMPDGTGFDLIESLPERHFQLIFVTAYNQYAQTAIRLGALDYLLKPVDPKELKFAIGQAKMQRLAQVQLEQLQVMQETLRTLTELHQESKRLPPRMAIPTSEGVHFFPPEDIIRLEGTGNYTRFFLRGEQSHLIASQSLGKYETDLKPYRQTIMRVHKSHMVNLFQVTRLIKGERASLELSDATVVPIGRKYRTAVERVLVG